MTQTPPDRTRHTGPQSGFEEEPPVGTMDCPICGSSVEHTHTGLEIHRHHERYMGKNDPPDRVCAKCLGTGLSGFGICGHCERQGTCCGHCCAHMPEAKQETEMSQTTPPPPPSTASVDVQAREAIIRLRDFVNAQGMPKCNIGDLSSPPPPPPAQTDQRCTCGGGAYSHSPSCPLSPPAQGPRVRCFRHKTGFPFFDRVRFVGDRGVSVKTDGSLDHCMVSLSEAEGRVREGDWIECADSPASVAQPNKTRDEMVAGRHAMNCPERSPGSDDSCTCGLYWRDALTTEQTMHAAWRKRAEEAEMELTALRQQPKPPGATPMVATLAQPGDLWRAKPEPYKPTMNMPSLANIRAAEDLEALDKIEAAKAAEQIGKPPIPGIRLDAEKVQPWPSDLSTLVGKRITTRPTPEHEQCLSPYKGVVREIEKGRVVITHDGYRLDPSMRYLLSAEDVPAPSQPPAAEIGEDWLPKGIVSPNETSAPPLVNYRDSLWRAAMRECVEDREAANNASNVMHKANEVCNEENERLQADRDRLASLCKQLTEEKAALMDQLDKRKGDK